MLILVDRSLKTTIIKETHINNSQFATLVAVTNLVGVLWMSVAVDIKFNFIGQYIPMCHDWLQYR